MGYIGVITHLLTSLGHPRRVQKTGATLFSFDQKTGRKRTNKWKSKTIRGVSWDFVWEFGGINSTTIKLMSQSLVGPQNSSSDTIFKLEWSIFFQMTRSTHVYINIYIYICTPIHVSYGFRNTSPKFWELCQALSDFGLLYADIRCWNSRLKHREKRWFLEIEVNNSRQPCFQDLSTNSHSALPSTIPQHSTCK